MLIDLTQQDTRCSNCPDKTEEQLIRGVSAVKAETEFIHVALQMNTSAMVGPHQKSLEIADYRMKPMQITSFIKFIAKRNIFQAAVTAISITLYLGLLYKILVHNLL